MKFRIVESKGVFYPERKTMFGWSRFDYMPTPIGTCTSSGHDGFGAFTVEDARLMIEAFVRRETDVIYNVTVQECE